MAKDIEEWSKCRRCGAPSTRIFVSRWAYIESLGLCDEHAEEHKDGLKAASYEEVERGDSR